VTGGGSNDDGDDDGDSCSGVAETLEDMLEMLRMRIMMMMRIRQHTTLGEIENGGKTSYNVCKWGIIEFFVLERVGSYGLTTTTRHRHTIDSTIFRPIHSTTVVPSPWFIP